MIIVILGYIVICILLTGVGLGLGFALHWIVPDIDMGFAALIGLLASGMALHFSYRILGHVFKYGDEILLDGMVASIREKEMDSRRRKRKQNG